MTERGFAGDQLEAIRDATDAQESDLFDVLAYIAFLRPPLKRLERVDERRETILSQYEPRQHEFIDFVLAQYVAVGETELDTDKLPELLQLTFDFSGFQRGLYA